MRVSFRPILRQFSQCLLLMASLVVAPHRVDAAGVTIITHGYAGNVNGWVTGMADQIANYDAFPGTNFTTYKVEVTRSGGNYLFTTTRVGGGSPVVTDSGEIIIKLDWSTLAGGFAPDSTYDVGRATALALMQTNMISELGGRAVGEFPLHLIGHSRGGSLICEISRHLGTNGVWVDHLTTLDPHPLNNDGFSDIPITVDAPARTYQNVLFHDNYWRNLDGSLFVPNGEPVFGAYQRNLGTLPGGYSSPHSDVHLWYHATIDWRTNASDTEASITSAEKTSWWTAYETAGTYAGFLYSLVGGGNRMSQAQPAGQGFGEISDGYNQWWDLGAGVFSNRTALPANNGNWPNLILFGRTQTNQVSQGSFTPVQFYYQWAKADTNLANVSIYLDDDLNPLNTNQTLLQTLAVPTNGASYVSLITTNITFGATNVPPGVYRLYAKITGGGRTRYLYAPDKVEVVASTQPPTLDVAKLSDDRLVIGINGVMSQTLVLHMSTNLQTWQPLATNSLTSSSRWLYTNNPPAGTWQQYFRATLSP